MGGCARKHASQMHVTRNTSHVTRYPAVGANHFHQNYGRRYRRQQHPLHPPLAAPKPLLQDPSCAPNRTAPPSLEGAGPPTETECTADLCCSATYVNVCFSATFDLLHFLQHSHLQHERIFSSSAAFVGTDSVAGDPVSDATQHARSPSSFSTGSGNGLFHEESAV